MKFKNSNKNSIIMMMSDRELKKYPAFNKETTIVDQNLPRTIDSTEKTIFVDKKAIKLKVRVEQDADVFRAKCEANNFKFTVTKTREIRKYDVFRKIIQNYDEITNKTVEM